MIATTESNLKALTEQLLGASTADQTEVVVTELNDALTRFANSEIHQNVSETDKLVRVQVAVGKRIGLATTNDLSETGLRQVLENAVSVARLQPENPEFVSFASSSPAPMVASTGILPDIEQRAEAVMGICRLADEAGLRGFGAYQARRRRLVVANSLGVFSDATLDDARVRVVAMGEDSSGYAERIAVTAAGLDPEALAREAIDKALRSAKPTDIEPGVYDVVLEPYAVADMAEYLAYLGFGSLEHQLGTSPLVGRLGQRIVGENVSIWDDGTDPSGLPMPFDFEGVPKRRVSLVDRGVAGDLVYDTFTANKEGRASTGHHYPAEYMAGPFPWNLFVAPGDQTLEQLVAGVERGIYVSRFHYTNVANPATASITGMTRDGTFLIENGRIVRPLKNMRFTESLFTAFSQVEAIGLETRLLPSWMGATSAPAMRIRGLTFTGRTEF